MTTARYLARLFVSFLVATGLLVTPAAGQQWTIGDQGVNWNVLSTFPTTGTLPQDAYEPADPPLPAGVVESDWRITIGDMQGTAQSGASFVKGADREKKVRVGCEPNNAKLKDNILGFGIPLFGHPHLGAGLVPWDENTTFQTARANPRSTCAGGPLLATNYMEPCLLIKQPNGAVLCWLYQDQINYYIMGVQSEPNKATYIRAGEQFLIGPNPKDMNDTRRRAIYAAAGFEYPGGMNYSAGQLGWYCIAGDGTPATAVGDARMRFPGGAYSSDKVVYLRGPNGEDPFGGTCTAVAGVPATLVGNLLAPGCNDGFNLKAPDGRSHWWYRARKTDNTITGACPTTTAGDSYVLKPELEVKSLYQTTGFSQYGQAYFESDRMRISTTECPDATAPCDGVSGGNVPATVNGVFYSRVSISPCRRTGLDFCNAETLHADYTNGWKQSIFDQVQREGLGITVRGIAPVDGPAEMNTNLIDRYTVLKTGLVDANKRQWIGQGCATLGNCYDSVPSKPNQTYRTIPGYQPGSVHIAH